jgi:hypothetical protein
MSLNAFELASIATLFLPLYSLLWLGAKYGRRMIGQALELTVADNDLTDSEADWAAKRISHDNALKLYRL